MITIYYSNKLECLKKILIELLSNKQLENVLYPEIILSENTAMIEWLYIKISEHFGISANIKFFSSFDFIWNILRKSLWGIFPKETISHSTISWILMKILSGINNKDVVVHNFSIIKEYLENDINKNKCLQFSEKIKNLFIQYFIYHQDWLFQWKIGNLVEALDIYTQSWQSELWRLFLKEVNNNHKIQESFVYFQYGISEYISNFFKKNNFNLKNKLPERIFICGISYFPPLLLSILQLLGKYIDIYILYINPCRFFLKHNINYNNIISIIQKRSQLFHCFSEIKPHDIFNRNVCLFNQDKAYNNIGNFLLSSFGGRFQEAFYSLLQLEVAYEKNIFIENINSGFLLHILQNDILNDYSQKFYSVSDIMSLEQNNIHSNVNNRLLSSDDRSLSVHICHNIQREIEVLHNNLLSIMSNDPLLLPHEIIVMAPNINDYISTIHSVFGSASIYNRYLPFTIFDDSINNMNIIMSSFLKLLNLSCMKFSVEDILELLSVPALAVRFNIDKDRVKLLTTWILESGICWGLDDESFSDYEICSDNKNIQYTWKFGLTRMLLNYAISATSGIWNNILPYNVGDSISFMDLVGQLSFFLMKLKYWKDRFLKSYILEEWLPLAEEIINDFYIIDYNIQTESTLVQLKFFWNEIINSGVQANYHDLVPINILYSKLYDRLLNKKKKIKYRFFSGNIVFCNLDSVESIPFKVIYLLGINVDFYPMNNKVPLNFDLMQYEARLSNCHSCCNDRYLFLAALLSARERLYISFVGYSSHDYTKLFSSIVIDELFEYIIHHFCYIEKNTKKISAINIDWIHHNLCYWHTHVPFSLKNFISGDKNQSFFKEWQPTFCDNMKVSNRKFLSVLPEIPISVIEFSSLHNFYFHPIRAWFQNRLKIYIPKVLEFPIDEPFSVRTSIKYQICEDLISAFLNKQDIDIIYKRFRYSGVFPYGNFGNFFWMQQCEKMLKLSKVVNEYYLSMNRYILQFSVKFHDNIQLTGTIINVQKNGLLRWKPRVLSIGDGLLLWLEHLVYSATGGKGDSWMFGINSSWHFVALSCTEAKEYLSFLISGYCHGLNTPLFLLNRSGGSWLWSCFDIKKRSISTDLNCQFKARCKLVAAWEGNQYIYGDSSDPYVRKLIPQLRDEDIESIISSAKKYFLFPMRFNI